MESFDVHESGQLRLGAAGDQLEVLPLEDERVPVSDGGRLTSPALEELGSYERAVVRHRAEIAAACRRRRG